MLKAAENTSQAVIAGYAGAACLPNLKELKIVKCKHKLLREGLKWKALHPDS